MTDEEIDYLERLARDEGYKWPSQARILTLRLIEEFRQLRPTNPALETEPVYDPFGYRIGTQVKRRFSC